MILRHGAQIKNVEMMPKQLGFKSLGIIEVDIQYSYFVKNRVVFIGKDISGREIERLSFTAKKKELEDLLVKYKFRNRYKWDYRYGKGD